MNAYTFRQAIREETSVMVGLAGPSGSGKTLSALRLARGLAGPFSCCPCRCHKA